MIEQIRPIAERVRAWADDWRRDGPVRFGEDLCGMCAICATQLHYELEKAGIEGVVIVANCYHVFLQWKHWIIDITATQFGEDRVMIKTRRVVNRSEDAWWKKDVVFTTREALHKWQHNWPGHQRCPETWTSVLKD